jgi:sec-independent protein translocase protein tatA/E homolog
MPNLGPTELIIIAVVLILLFGSKKLPDAARSIGRSMRIFKSEVKELNNDDQVTAAAEPRQIEQSQPQQAPQAKCDTQHNTSA